MPAAAHQSSPRLTTPAAGTPLGAPAAVGVLALVVGDVATALIIYNGIAGLAFRVIDVYAVKTGGTAAASANTDQLRTLAGTDITNAMNMQVADEAIVRAGEINDANHQIAAGVGIRINHVKAGQNSACVVYVKIALI